MHHDFKAFMSSIRKLNPENLQSEIKCEIIEVEKKKNEKHQAYLSQLYRFYNFFNTLNDMNYLTEDEVRLYRNFMKRFYDQKSLEPNLMNVIHN